MAIRGEAMGRYLGDWGRSNQNLKWGTAHASLRSAVVECEAKYELTQKKDVKAVA